MENEELPEELEEPVTDEEVQKALDDAIDPDEIEI